ncbi:MAG: 16S rRNA (guanine(966)-N(2))-methyltransferase RsmD [Myxococcota bacterium]
MRVTAGALRGRRLLAPRGRDTRPTSDRARAGLFDWLGSAVAESLWLDLFAGSGSVGIEALSRGALHVVFVERSRAACQVLGRNLAALGLEARSRVLDSDVSTALARLSKRGERFDWIFADPPWARGPGPELAALVARVAPGGRLVVERGAHHARAAAPAGLVHVESRAWGETLFDRYRREESGQ